MMLTGPLKDVPTIQFCQQQNMRRGDEYSVFVLSVAERSGAYMPLFNGDSYLQLKGLHLYGHDLR